MAFSRGPTTRTYPTLRRSISRGRRAIREIPDPQGLRDRRAQQELTDRTELQVLMERRDLKDLRDLREQREPRLGLGLLRQRLRRSILVHPLLCPSRLRERIRLRYSPSRSAYRRERRETPALRVLSESRGLRERQVQPALPVLRGHRGLPGLPGQRGLMVPRGLLELTASRRP